jgi:hypothetical protein
MTRYPSKDREVARKEKREERLQRRQPRRAAKRISVTEPPGGHGGHQLPRARARLRRPRTPAIGNRNGGGRVSEPAAPPAAELACGAERLVRQAERMLAAAEDPTARIASSTLPGPTGMPAARSARAKCMMLVANRPGSKRLRPVGGVLVLASVNADPSTMCDPGESSVLSRPPLA